MIPILYDKDETEFTSNGLMRLRDCISCRVFEERNSIYECDFEYPVSGAGFAEIQPGRIIGVSHSDSLVSRSVRSLVGLTDEENDNITDENNLMIVAATEENQLDYDIQPFDIVSFTRPINGVVTFHCVHISYRLSYATCISQSIYSLADAFADLHYSTPRTPFTFWTDKSSQGYLGCADGIPHTVRSMLGGMEGSILDAYGGEFEWDKWTVKLWASRGQVRNFSIRYGLNMLDYNEEYDIQGTFSSCYPYWTDGTTLEIAGKVTANGTTVTGREACVPLDLSDKFETMPSIEDLQAEALAYMNVNRTFMPMQNIYVEFVRLQDLGYEEYENLLDCNLCDTITVVFPDYNGSAQYKIVKTVWDVLRDRYESMELGDLSTTLAEALGITPDTSNTSPTIGDYVVEQGTSGIWTYRKWNSGVAECWGYQTKTASGTGVNFAINFPTSLFIVNPTVICSAGASGEADAGINYVNGTTGYIDAWVHRSQSGSNSVWVFAHALGNWK